MRILLHGAPRNSLSQRPAEPSQGLTRMPPIGRMPKRRAAGSAASSDAYEMPNEGTEVAQLRAMNSALVAQHAALHSPIKSQSVFNMREEESKAALADALWTADFQESTYLLRLENPELVAVLRAQMQNTSDMTDARKAAIERHIDGVLLDVCRAQNKDRVPLLTAAFAITAEANKPTRELHDMHYAWHMGADMSEKWVADFLPIAIRRRPAPDFDAIDGIVACCFDNLSIKMDYKSYSAGGETGRMLEMTNWFATRLPKHLAPTFDAAAACEWPASLVPPSRTHERVLCTRSSQRYLSH